MARPTDQEIQKCLPLKRWLVTFTDPKKRGHGVRWGATWGSTRAGQEAEGRARGKHA